MKHLPLISALLVPICLVSCAPKDVTETTAHPTHETIETLPQTTKSDRNDPSEVKYMKWSEDIIIPRFPEPADRLDAITSGAMSHEEQVTFSTLQGIVNRTKPRILLIDEGADEGGETWAKTFGVRYKITTAARKYDLVAKYATEFDGVVLYSTDKSEHYTNLACTIANTMNALPMTKAVYDKVCTKADVTPEIVCDLTGLEMTKTGEIYTYLYENYWDKCSHRLLFSENASDGYHMRDLAAATGSAIVWLDCTNGSQKRTFLKLLADMTPGSSACLGFYTTERSGITTAASVGISTIPADLFCNATVWAGLDAEIAVPTYDKIDPTVEDKLYVAVYVSDGDNTQYVQRAMRKLWDSTKGSRGKVPINWTIAPALVDLAPQMLNYYYGSATKNDYFVCGPSGMGYAMFVNTLAEKGAPAKNYLDDTEIFSKYVALTQKYLVRSGLRTVTGWDDLTDDQRAAYIEGAPYLLGLTVQKWEQTTQTIDGTVGGKYIAQLTPCYESAYDALLRNVKTAIGDWDGSSPRFVSCQISVWSPISVSGIGKLYDDLTAIYGEGKVEFVRADEYFTLYNINGGNDADLALLEGTTITNDGKMTTVDLGDVRDLSYCNIYLTTGERADVTLSISADGGAYTPWDGKTPTSARYVRFESKELSVRNVDVYGKLGMKDKK